MAPDDSRDFEWLDRYLAGEGTVDERTMWQRRIAADPVLRSIVDGVGRATDRPVRAPRQWDVEAAWQEAARREGDRPTPVVVRPRTLMPNAARIAAAIAVVAIGIAAVRSMGWFGHTEPVREFASARASRVTVTLRDGTELVLGPATHLRVPSDFGESTRTVELDGEALFTVVHDGRHPFIVQTSHATVRDVGTTFVVHAYAADLGAQVAVAEGEVALAGEALRARDVASIDAGGRLSIRRDVDVSRYLGWVRGGLVFEDTPLRDVVREMARTYDLDVSIADSTLAGSLVTASFGSESADVVLDVVTRAVGAHYERVGRAIVIRRGVVPIERQGKMASPTLRMARGGADR
jgi:ferric-dicitrate binding protein FerR (iron transport regulator)